MSSPHFSHHSHLPAHTKMLINLYSQILMDFLAQGMLPYFSHKVIQGIKVTYSGNITSSSTDLYTTFLFDAGIKYT